MTRAPEEGDDPLPRGRRRRRRGAGRGAQRARDDRFGRLSDEQRHFVTELTTSGLRVQAPVGLAPGRRYHRPRSGGRRLARVRLPGDRLRGRGTQSVLLGEEADRRGRAPSPRCGRDFDYADESRSIGAPPTVLLVDEASRCSRPSDFATAREAVGRVPGAILRLVGDPAVHSDRSAAGGFVPLARRDRRRPSAGSFPTSTASRARTITELRLAD